MTYTVVIRCITKDWYSYGPFYSKIDAAKWAEKYLTIEDWTIVRYRDKNELK